MSRYHILFILASGAILTSATPAGEFAGGTGTADDPYQIATAEQLNAIGADPALWGQHFRLNADIDLADYRGTRFNVIGYWRSDTDNKPFTGVFDGDGHRMAGFTYTCRNRDCTGLFGYVAGPQARIERVTLLDPVVYVQGGGDVGTLVGRLTGGLIIACHVQQGLVLADEGAHCGLLVGRLELGTIADCNVTDGIISGNESVGGLVGEVGRGTIDGCRADSIVMGNQEAGGLVGTLAGTVESCRASGTVMGDAGIGGLVGSGTQDSVIADCRSTAAASGTTAAGGLTGLNAQGAIVRCCALGDVAGTTRLGGLVGDNQGSITNSYSLGSVTGPSDVPPSGRTRSGTPGPGPIGGLVGSNSGSIAWCYAAGLVSSSLQVGGLVGSSDYRGQTVESFWDTQTSGRQNSAGGMGKTTAELRSADTFSLWGVCENAGVWTLDEGNDYPRLSWEARPGHAIVLPHLDGAGTPDDPYLVSTPEELARIGLLPCDWDKHFRLTADIDLAGTPVVPIGRYADLPTTEGARFARGVTISSGPDEAQAFRGVFDGNGKSIRHLTCVVAEGDQAGLFGFVYGEKAEIRDLTLIEPDIGMAGGQYVGALAGRVGKGTVVNCHVEGGRVVGGTNVGGLVGGQSGTVERCHAHTSVSGQLNVGGLVGSNGGTISDSCATGAVTGDSHVGGLTGIGAGSIRNCYAAGPVAGREIVGGFSGSFDYGSLIACYATGAVTGDKYVGGLVGSPGYSALVVRSFWDMDSTGQHDSAAGTGKTTAEMQQAGTFLIWGTCDSENKWTIESGRNYPSLWWEGKPGDAIPAVRPSDHFEGAGTPESPYLIRTAEQLLAVGLFPCAWDKHFLLRADIDLGTYGGTAWNAIGDRVTPFTGVFDGGGHAIANFTREFWDGGGLFGFIDDPNARISDLTLLDPNVVASAASGVGALVGWLRAGTVIDCTVRGGSVSGAYAVGGLVGRNGDTTAGSRDDAVVESSSFGSIVHCSSISSVVGVSQVGGLVGQNYGTLAGCGAGGRLSGKNYLGGLVGYNESQGVVVDCYGAGDVTGSGREAGGLIGHNAGTVRTSYATGPVSGDGVVGGLVGYNQTGVINTCYSTGPATGNSSIGGLVGTNHNRIGDCYCTGAVTGNEYVGGLIGSSYSFEEETALYWDIQTSGQTADPHGAGKTTAQMHDPNTFLAGGWGFVNLAGCRGGPWALDSAGGYPVLWWQLSPEQLPALPFAGGTGTAEDPYLIASAESLNSIGYNPRLLASHFQLISAIDLAGMEFFSIGSEMLPFAGVFDGAGHSISNFTHVFSDGSQEGLFRHIDGSEARISGLTLLAPQVEGAEVDTVGSLAGCLRRGIIEDCCVQDGRVTGRYIVGGMVGRNEKGTITSCRVSGTVTGEHTVGGVVAGNSGSLIGCRSTATVSSVLTVGGLVGSNSGSVTGCCSLGSVQARDCAGGLIGGNWGGTVADCYATGKTSGEDRIGGLVGENEGTVDKESTLSNCYAAGAVAAVSHGGGLVGYGWGDMQGSFWDIEAAATTDSDGGTGQSTAAMRTAATFLAAGWDFADTWMICEGKDYPRLQWEGLSCNP
jgi:hypothetical protein